MISIVCHTGDDVGIQDLYALLRLRSRVFVLEQGCRYEDTDGCDLLSTTHHHWSTQSGELAAYLRVALAEDGLRVGRVCTQLKFRGRGLAKVLLEDVVARFGSRNLLLSAQSHLVGFYESFGFRPDGPEAMEDGLFHTPMSRPGIESGDVPLGRCELYT